MKNKVAVAGFFIILLLVFCALFPSLIAPYSYETMSTGPSFANPSAEHLFGTDEFGRDIFSRVIYGTRTLPWPSGCCPFLLPVSWVPFWAVSQAIMET